MNIALIYPIKYPFIMNIVNGLKSIFAYVKIDAKFVVIQLKPERNNNVYKNTRIFPRARN